MCRPHTVRAYLGDIRSLQAHLEQCGITEVAEIDIVVLRAWLATQHAAGQSRPTPLMLRYGPGDWNALHRDLYGELVFPLQVVIGLNDPRVVRPESRFPTELRHDQQETPTR